MADILCIGNPAVDLIARTIDEYPPRGGVRSFEALTLAAGGCAVNCAIALARLGLETDLIVKLGDDRLGRFLLDEIRAVGVGCDAVLVEPGATTPLSFVAVHSDAERSFLHHPGTNATFSPEDVDRSKLRDARFVVMTGAMTLPRMQGEPAAAVLAEARHAGAVTVMETVYTDQANDWREALDPCLPHVDYFAPSLAEAAALTGESQPEAMAQVLADRGAHSTVIKLGSRGAYVRDTAGHCEIVPAFTVKNVVDTTGAGNCFVAGLVAGLRSGYDLPRAVRLGNAVASYCITQPGATAGVPALEEALALMDSCHTKDGGAGQ